MRTDTRMGYVIDRLTWVLLGVGIAIHSEMNLEDRVIVWVLGAVRIGAAVKDLMDRRRFP